MTRFVGKTISKTISVENIAIKSTNITAQPICPLALSGSLRLSEFAYKALAWLTRPLLGS